MNKFVLYGNYTTEAIRGFIAQPDQNRRVAAEMIAEAVGAEVLDFFPHQRRARLRSCRPGNQ